MLEITQFQDADKYSEYLRTFSGRLRSDLMWEKLRYGAGYMPAHKVIGVVSRSTGWEVRTCLISQVWCN